MGRRKSLITATTRQHFMLDGDSLRKLDELQQTMDCATASETLRKVIKHWHEVATLVQAGGRVQQLRPDGTYETQRYLALEKPFAEAE